MKKSVFLCAAMLIMLGTSCATYVTGRDGSRYKALTSSQTEHLVNISRAALKRNLDKNIISRTEFQDAMRYEPMVRVDYRGDRFGTAKVIWRTRGRQLEFTYDEDLTAEIIPKCSFATYIIPAHERRIQPDKSIQGR